MILVDYDVVKIVVGFVYIVFGWVDGVVDIRVGVKSVWVDDFFGWNFVVYNKGVFNDIL